MGACRLGAREVGVRDGKVVGGARTLRSGSVELSVRGGDNAVGELEAVAYSVVSRPTGVRSPGYVARSRQSAECTKGSASA